MRRVIDNKERRLLLAARHRLVPSMRTDDPTRIADSLVGLHSSDPATPFLSVAARMNTPSVSALESALYDDRLLMRHHAMRRTLWVMTSEMTRIAHASATVDLSGPQERRLTKLLEHNGIAKNGEEWIQGAKHTLRDAIRGSDGTTTRQLSGQHPDVAVKLRSGSATVSALPRVLLLLGFEGSIIRTRPTGSWTSSQYRWMPAERWMAGVFDPPSDHSPSAALIHKYLVAFGPATLVDVHWWSGWTKAKTLRALAEAQSIEVDLPPGTGWVDRDHDSREVTDEPFVAFLPGLDPTTMGWKERDWYLDPDDVPVLFDRNGNAGPTVWMDGRVVGGWAQTPSGRVVYELTDGDAVDRSDEIRAAATRLETFFGDTRHKVRFPAPIQKRLLADEV